MYFPKKGKHWKTKRGVAEITALALTRLLAINGEKVGPLHMDKMFSGRKAMQSMATALLSEPGAKSFRIKRSLPENSTVFLFGDFLDRGGTARMLSQMSRAGICGWLIMTLTPEEIDPALHGAVKIKGLEDEEPLEFKKGEEILKDYYARLDKHIEAISAMARKKGFGFILQRTDESPRETLKKIYGLKPSPAPVPGMARG
jgi:hypothetical protein